MKEKKKAEILYKYFAKPISEMKMTYECSALTVENKLVDKSVLSAFELLVKALKNQYEKL